MNNPNLRSAGVILTVTITLTLSSWSPEISS